MPQGNIKRPPAPPGRITTGQGKPTSTAEKQFGKLLAVGALCLVVGAASGGVAVWWATVGRQVAENSNEPEPADGPPAKPGAPGNSPAVKPAKGKQQPPSGKPPAPPAKPPKPAPASGATQNDHDAIARWINENEGDPNVQMISTDGPRRSGDKRVFLVKYRCKNAFNALTVENFALAIRPDGSASILSGERERSVPFFYQLAEWDDPDGRTQFQKAFEQRLNVPLDEKPPPKKSRDRPKWGPSP